MKDKRIDPGTRVNYWHPESSIKLRGVVLSLRNSLFGTPEKYLVKDEMTNCTHLVMLKDVWPLKEDKPFETTITDSRRARIAGYHLDITRTNGEPASVRIAKDYEGKFHHPMIPDAIFLEPSVAVALAKAILADLDGA